MRYEKCLCFCFVNIVSNDCGGIKLLISTQVSSSSSSSTSSFSSDEETDARDLKPIRGYLQNRRELSRQLFKSVKADKIRMMLPQILKVRLVSPM